jgi:hypothetical protein
MPAGPKEASRNAKRASIGFVVGLIALLISFASSWVVGLIGFLAMLASAVVLVQSLRRLAQDRWGRETTASKPEAQEQGRPGGRWWPGWGSSGGRSEEDTF